MKKIFLVFLLFLLTRQVNAQIEVSKLVGKNTKDYLIGFGGSLSFSYALSEASDLNLELGVKFFPLKESDFSQGIYLFPVKLGYRYTLDGTGTGFYVEPEIGYCVLGLKSDDEVEEKINGFVWSAGAGYIFPSSRGSKYSLGLRYESVKYKNGSVNFIALRLAHGFSFGRRNSD